MPGGALVGDDSSDAGCMSLCPSRSRSLYVSPSLSLPLSLDSLSLSLSSRFLSRSLSLSSLFLLLSIEGSIQAPDQENPIDFLTIYASLATSGIEM